MKSRMKRGIFLALPIFRELPGILFVAALVLMIIGAWHSTQDKPLKEVLIKSQTAD